MTKEERERIIRIVDAVEGGAPDGRGPPLPEDLREEAARFREAVDLLRPPPAPEPGPWMARRLRAQLETRRRRRFVGAFAAAIFGPGVAVAAVLLLFMGRDTPAPTASVLPLPEIDVTLLDESELPLTTSEWALPTLPTEEAVESLERRLLGRLAEEGSEEAVETLSRETALGLDLDLLVDEWDVDESIPSATNVPG